MTQPEEDPRSTAYVMGELVGADLAQFLAEVQQSTSLQQEVAQIRAMVDLVQAACQTEPEPELQPARRQQLEQQWVSLPAKAQASLPTGSGAGAENSVSRQTPDQKVAPFAHRSLWQRQRVLVGFTITASITFSLLVALWALAKNQMLSPFIPLGAHFPTKMVFVAKDKLTPGVKLDLLEKQVEVKPVTQEWLECTPGALEVTADAALTLRERRVKYTINAGEVLSLTKLTDPGPTVSLASLLDSGQRAWAMPFDTQDATGCQITVGSRVDLIHVPNNPRAADLKTRIIMQNVKVIAINGTTLDQEFPSKGMKVNSVTFAVTPEQVEKLSLATEIGKLKISLRKTDDDQVVLTPGSSTDDFVGLVRDQQWDRQSLLPNTLAQERVLAPSLPVNPLLLTPFSRAGYLPVKENLYRRTHEIPLSTFAIELASTAYTKIRRFLQQEDQLPPPNVVRIEEMLNYFRYDYTPPADNAADPFAIHIEIAPAPWEPQHRLARIGLQGKAMRLAEQPPTQLVFLIDTSSSMQEPNRLPLLQQALNLLTQQLNATDQIAIVTYAGNTSLVLPSTPATAVNKAKIGEAIRNCAVGTSTVGVTGIELAYQIAAENLFPGGVNRVILFTDGDCNVGLPDDGTLTRFIREQAKSGVYLSVLGVGPGNLPDKKMELLAEVGNGLYYYLDTLQEAQRVLVDQLAGTLGTIAKEVTIQVEFNPAQVAAYRLLGYENRLGAIPTFSTNRIEATAIGAGHSVTALYELIPPTEDSEQGRLDSLLKYQPSPSPPTIPTEIAQELFTVQVRYKQPNHEKTKKVVQSAKAVQPDYTTTSRDFRFAAAVAGFGMLLQQATNSERLSYPLVLELAGGATATESDRQELLQLVRRAQDLTQRHHMPPTAPPLHD